MESEDSSVSAPNSVRLALRLGWGLIIIISTAKLWPFWSNALSQLPARSNWIADVIGLLVASVFLVFTPVLIGQLVAVVCLVFLARRQGWARWVFVAGLVVSVMTTIAAFVSKAHVVSRGLLSLQLVLLAIQLVVVSLLFGTQSSDWFKVPRPSRPRSRVGRSV